jgi:tRNA A37 N6-isopentenylltransferase MiaA
VRVAQRAEAQRQQHEELLALLGEGRLAEFERAQNNDYQQLYRLGNSLSLSQDEVSGLYEQHRQAEELARQWRADKNLSAEERSARLTELRDRLEDDFRTRLGPANYEIFRQQGPGHWIQGLQ